MIDLSTKYMNLDLKNPLIASPSPLCEEVDNIRQMEDSGVAAVVLHSLFEEQINYESKDLDEYLSQGTDRFAESLTYFPELSDFKLTPDEYLEHIRKAKEAVDIPIIGSLNGVSTGGWVKYAKEIEEAGADALELNIYFIPTDPDMTSNQVDQMYVYLVRDVKSTTHIPVAVKLAPYFSSMPYVARRLDSMPHMARRLNRFGADALVLFNRFYQPDLDIESLKVNPDLILSSSDELRLRLRWIAILYGHIQADMAVTGGVHTPEDVVKTMMAGANVAMMTSALLKNGIQHVEEVLNGLNNWIEEHDYESVSQMQGVMSQKSVDNPASFERANYMKVLSSYKERI